MSQLSSDDQIDRDLRNFLDWQAGQVDGAPSAASASARLAQRLGTGARAWPTGRLVWVVVILALLLSVAVGGVLVGSRGPGPLAVDQPSPPVQSAQPTASSLVPPAALQAIWIGQPKLVPALSGVPELGLLHISGSAAFLFNGGGSQPILRSSATSTGPTSLTLTLDAATNGCPAGTRGVYAWSESADGARLTLSANYDDCALRAAVFTGIWTRSDCRNPSDTCLGAIPAGSFNSTFFDIRDSSANIPSWGAYGQLRYSVPAGWANRDDWPTNFSLMPGADYAGPGGDPSGNVAHGIYLYARPAALAATADCSARLTPGVLPTPSALAAWLSNRPDLVTSHPVPIALDGNAGWMVDVRLAPKRGTVCPGDTQASAPLLNDAGGASNQWSLRVGADEQERIILVAVGGHTLAIVIDDTSTPSRFEGLVTEAMPIVDAFAFPQ